MSKISLYTEFKYKVAQEALSGIKTSYLARQHSVTTKTVSNWIKEYREKFGDDALPTASKRIEQSKRLQELEETHAKAIKLLGEKELENEILRELIKKLNPAYPTKSK